MKRIERFCRVAGMAESTFSRKAFADSRLVYDLKRGREPRAETIDRAEQFIDAERQRFRMIADTLDAMEIER